MIQEGEGHWPNSSDNLQKKRGICGCCALRRTIKRKVREQRGSCYAEHAEQKDPSSKMRLSARKVPIVLFLSHNRTRTNTNPNVTEANAAGRSGNARALRKQCKWWNDSGGRGALAKFKFLGKFAKSEVFVGVAHSAEQQRGRRASKEARDMRNTKSTRQRSKCAFQRARRLLLCP